MACCRSLLLVFPTRVIFIWLFSLSFLRAATIGDFGLNGEFLADKVGHN